MLPINKQEQYFAKAGQFPEKSLEQWDQQLSNVESSTLRKISNSGNYSLLRFLPVLLVSLSLIFILLSIQLTATAGLVINYDDSLTEISSSEQFAKQDDQSFDSFDAELVALAEY